MSCDSKGISCSSLSHYLRNLRGLHRKTPAQPLAVVVPGSTLTVAKVIARAVERFKQEEHQLAISLKTILQLRDEERNAFRAQLDSAHAYARQLEAQLDKQQHAHCGHALVHLCELWLAREVDRLLLDVLPCDGDPLYHLPQ